jgi:peptidoglycan/LPS O-acetylase OafA/YrhL
MNTKRIDALNGLRGLAACAVALEHFVISNTYTNPGELRFEVSAFVGGVAVAVFFLISGFVTPIAFGSTSAREFLIRRVLRLYPVFAVCCLLHVGVGIMVGNYAANFDMVRLYFLMISLIGGLWEPPHALPQPVVWTLQIELKFYLVCAAILWLSRGSWASVNRLALGFLIVLAMVAFKFPGLGPPWTGDIGFAVTMLPFMFAAFFVSLHFTGRISAGDMWLGMLVSGCVFMMGPMRLFTTWGAPLMSFVLAAAIFGIVFVYRDSIPFLRGRVANYLGEISYPMYAIHTAVSTVVFSYTPHGKLPLKFVLYVPAVLIASYLIHQWIEKPAIALSKRLAPGRRNELTRTDYPPELPLGVPQR